MPTTSRLGLRYPAGTDAPDFPQKMGYLAQDADIIAVDSQGTLASRPAATTYGRYYHCTDDYTSGPGGTLFRADGSTWRVVGPEISTATDLVQEGVLSSTDGAVTRTNANLVAVTAGAAWIDGDGAGGFSGRYRVTWPAVSLAISNSIASNGRLDQIIVQLPTTGSVAAATVLAGTNTNPAPTLTNRTSAASLPAGALRLADIVVTATSGVAASTDIRDRRSWARGAYFRHTRTTNEAGGSHYSAATTTYINLDATNFYPRIECTGNIFEIRIEGNQVNFNASTTDRVIVAPWVDGAVEPTAAHRFSTSEVPPNTSAEGFHLMTYAPAAGSHRIGIGHKTQSGTSALGWYCSATTPLTVTVREVLNSTANASNGTN